MSSSGGGIIIIHNVVPGTPVPEKHVHLVRDEFIALVSHLLDGELKAKLLALLEE